MEAITQINDRTAQKKFMLALEAVTMLAMLNMTTVTMALPTYMEVFGVDINTVQWVTLAYMLPLGMVMPLSGYFGERYGYRKVFLSALVVMGVCSVACACAPNFTLLIIFRCIKGLAAGILSPSTMAMLYRFLPKQYQARYLGQIVLLQSVGVAIGPTLAGFVLQISTWPVLFLVNVPFVIMAYWVGSKYIPKEKGQVSGSVDFFGILEISVGTGLVMVAFSEGDSWGWNSVAFWGSTIVGLMLMILFILRQFRSREPLLNFKILKYRPFTVALLIQCSLAMTLGITGILLQLYFQTVRGYSPAETGLFVLIPSLVMMVGNEIASKAHGKVSVRTLLFWGMAVAVFGNWAWCVLTVESSVVILILFFSIRYMGMGMLQMPLTDYGLGCVPAHLSGHASSMFNWTRQFVQVIATDVFTVLLSLNINRYYLEAGNTGIPVEGTAAYNIAASHAVGTDFVYMTVFLVLSLIGTLFIKPSQKDS